MKTWNVTAAAMGGVFLGQFAAETAEEAIQMALNESGSITLCHHCAQKISDPEIDEGSVAASPAEEEG